MKKAQELGLVSLEELMRCTMRNCASIREWHMSQGEW